MKRKLLKQRAQRATAFSIAVRLADALSGRQPASELAGMVERYETSDIGAATAAVAQEAAVFEPDDFRPEAAE